MKPSSKTLCKFTLAFFVVVKCLCATSLLAIPPQLGSKKVIVMLVDFPDLTNSAPSGVSVSNTMMSVSSFFQQSSFNQFSITSTVIGTLHLPANSATYVSANNVWGLRNDAFTLARAIGCEPTNYDYDIVTFTNIGFDFAGSASVGGRGLWIQNFASTTPFDPGVTAHEMGHNFGLGHAHAWISPTVIGAGANGGTGNLFDTMGSGPFPYSHFNSNFKFQLGWLTTNSAQTVSSNGIYRIYVMDGGGTINSARIYSLVVPAAITTTGDPVDYWIECRQLISNASLNNGIVVMWGNTLSTDDCFVLDTTPGSQAGILDSSDCPVTLGRSFTDPNKRITIAPVAKGGTGADTYFDVQVTLNSTTTPPAIVTQPASLTALAGSNALIGVTGVSSSPINYHWQRYGASIPGTNAVLVLTNISAAAAGDYTVILSNSLGSVESALATLTVAYPPPPSCYPIPPGIVAWWPGNGYPLDWIGTNHGVLQQTAGYCQGEVGQAFALNGTTDYVKAPSSPSWAFGTNDFTIELWANFSVLGGDRALVANDDGGGTQNKWIFWLNDSQLRFHCVNTSGNVINVGSADFVPATNQWYHLALTRIGSAFTFYINAAPVSTNVGAISVPITSAPLTIGESEGAMFFGGLLDEIRIYNRGLSASEILGIYGAGGTGVCAPSSPPAYLVFTTPVATVQEGRGSAALGIRRTGNLAATVSVKCVSADGTAVAGVNYAAVSNAITFNPSESNKMVAVDILNDGVADGTRQFTLQLKGASTNAVIGAPSTGTVTIVDKSCRPPPAGVVGWWPGDGNANDFVNTNNAVMQGGAIYAPGKVGLGFFLPFSPAYVSIPNNPLWAFGTNDFSLELWANFSTSSGSQAMLAYDQGGGSQPKWIFWLTGGMLELQVHGTLSSAFIDTPAFTPNTNSWYHLVVTRSNTTFNFYVNGSLFSTATSAVAIPYANAPLTIGEAEGAFNFIGILDDIRIYNRALNSSEIQAIYNSGSDGMCPPSPPVFTVQPQSQTVKVGASLSFTAMALGFTPLYYQWLHDGTNLALATTNSLNLTNVQTANAGDYSVVIANIAGSITSTNATLTVNPPLPTTFQSIKRLSDGRIQLIISGDPGSINTLEFSTNLFDWQILSNITLPGIPVTLTNTPATNSLKGFYRALSTGVAQ